MTEQTDMEHRSEPLDHDSGEQPAVDDTGNSDSFDEDTLRHDRATGLFGLALIWVAMGIAMPIAMRLTNEQSGGQPSQWLIAVYIQTIIIPPLIASVFAMVVPMLVNRSVFFRCGLCAAIFLPGAISMLSCIYLILGDWIEATSLIMFAAGPVAACVVGILIQLVSGKSLHHLRKTHGEANRLGIRTLMELTLLVSVLMALTAAMDDVTYWYGGITAAIYGGIATLFTVGACKAFLSEVVRRQSILFALVLCWIVSFALILFFLSQGFTMNMTATDWYRLSLYPLVGVASSGLMLWLCVGTLRRAGWRFGRADVG